MKKIIACLLVSLVAFLPMAATAADKTAQVEEKEEYTGRVLLEYEKYPISHYKLETDVGDGILDSPDRALASLVNGIWTVSYTHLTLPTMAVV